MKKRFEGKIAFITGAASGIGRAVVEGFCAEGGTAAAIDINEAGLAETAETTGATPYVCDVSSPEQVNQTVAAVEKEVGPVYLLANVAGIGEANTIEGIRAVTDESWDRTLRVNLGGPFYLCRALLPLMAKRETGAVVNVSSLAGRSKSANAGVPYSASKAGLLGLTRHLAFEFGPQGVRVNAICPGGVDTPMIRHGGAGAAESDEEIAARIKRIEAYQYFMPIKRLSTPEEQTKALLFLASEEASYINGASLDVNGGLFMA